MKFECPFCKQSYNGTAEYIGKDCRCAKCNQHFILEPISGSDMQAGIAQHKVCQFCGETILAVAKKCRYCGEFLDSKATGKKYDRGTYVCYALFLGYLGFHCYYVDKKARTWAHFAFTFLTLLGPFLVAIIAQSCGMRNDDAGDLMKSVFAILATSNTLWVIFEAFEDPNRAEE